jgi:hypothetical protein
MHRERRRYTGAHLRFKFQFGERRFRNFNAHGRHDRCDRCSPVAKIASRHDLIRVVASDCRLRSVRRGAFFLQKQESDASTLMLVRPYGRPADSSRLWQRQQRECRRRRQRRNAFRNLHHHRHGNGWHHNALHHPSANADRKLKVGGVLRSVCAILETTAAVSIEIFIGNISPIGATTVEFLFGFLSVSCRLRRGSLCRAT